MRWPTLPLVAWLARHTSKVTDYFAMACLMGSSFVSLIISTTFVVITHLPLKLTLGSIDNLPAKISPFIKASPRRLRTSLVLMLPFIFPIISAWWQTRSPSIKPPAPTQMRAVECMFPFNVPSILMSAVLLISPVRVTPVPIIVVLPLTGAALLLFLFENSIRMVFRLICDKFRFRNV